MNVDPFEAIIIDLNVTKLCSIRKFRPKRFCKIGTSSKFVKYFECFLQFVSFPGDTDNQAQPW
jgi:hypothetical protein